MKLYVLEPGSDEAARRVEKIGQVPFTPLHDVEIRNTLRALGGRKVLTEAQRAAAEHTAQEDIFTRRLRPISPDWPATFAAALDLSGRYTVTAKTLARSFDLLHVSIALDFRCGLFIPGDQRQFAVAWNMKMEVVFISSSEP